MAASQEGRTDVVELLTKHNADVNARTEVRLHKGYLLMRKIVCVCVCVCVCVLILITCCHLLIPSEWPHCSSNRNTERNS